MSEGVWAGIGELREAFRAAAPHAAAAVDTIAARWYDGSEPYDTSHLDTGPVDPGLPVVNGRLNVAYVSAGRDGSPASRFSTGEVAGDLWLTLEYSHQRHQSPRQLRLEIVEYFEDGFVFHRREVIADAPAESDGHTFQLSVGMQFLSDTDAHSGEKLWKEYVPHGRYWIFVYHDDRKVAEVEYEITP